ncbi:MAG: hypothetical protein ABW185_06475 [Sedimenticola sp.]
MKQVQTNHESCIQSVRQQNQNKINLCPNNEEIVIINDNIDITPKNQQTTNKASTLQDTNEAVIINDNCEIVPEVNQCLSQIPRQNDFHPDDRGSRRPCVAEMAANQNPVHVEKEPCLNQAEIDPTSKAEMAANQNPVHAEKEPCLNQAERDPTSKSDKSEDHKDHTQPFLRHGRASEITWMRM